MMKFKDWLLVVLAPFTLAIVIDHATKWFAFRIVNPVVFPNAEFFFFANEGFALGSLSSLSKIYTVVLPSSLGGLLVFMLLVLQYFLPIYSPVMRFGASLLVGSMCSNVLDRIVRGYVVDFIVLKVGSWHTGVFNVADALQWVGLGIGLCAYIANGRLLYPVDQRRGRKWIDPQFQLQYCLKLLTIGICFGLISGALSYTYINILIPQIQGLPVAAAQDLTVTFIGLFAATSASFLVILFITGVHLSHRIVGPVHAFENFLNDFLSGKRREFRLRQNDELKQLETIADRFLQNFNDAAGIQPVALAEGDLAPAIEGTTSQGVPFDPEQIRGKKAWMIFYRYATCPLCALHLDGLGEVISAAKANGVVVLAVYESSPAEFENAKCGATSQMLRTAGIPMIADEERKLYRAFKTRQNKLAGFTPKTVWTLIKASWRNFRQDSIDGKFGQLPSHFLIDEKGVIGTAFYGESFTDHIDLEVVRKFIFQAGS